MTTRRIFLAIDLSPQARAECDHHIDSLRNKLPNVRVGWEQPEKLHITLKFLGDTDEAPLPDLRSAIEKVAAKFHSFTLRLAVPGVFPSQRKPRILWIGVNDEANVVRRLHADVEAACSDLGFEREDRSFVTHVTIGRMRQPDSGVRLIENHLAAQIKPVEFDVSAVAIYESKLLRIGSVYSRLWRIGLESP